VPQTKDGLQETHPLFWFLFLAGTYTLIALVLFIEFQSSGARIKDDDFKDYVLGWIFFVPLGLGIATLSGKLNQLILNCLSFYRLAATANFFYLLYLLYPGTWLSSQNGKEISLKGCFAFLMVQFFIFLIIKTAQVANSKLLDFFDKNAFFFTGFIFMVWVCRLTFYCYDFIYHFQFYNFLIFLLIALLFYLSLSAKVEKIWLRLAAQLRLSFLLTLFASYPIVLLFIVLVVINPNFIFDRYHCKDFIGPLADSKGGKALLVNINSQHGILIFYFLSLFFKILPLGFKSLCLVNTFLFIVQYFCFYFILRQLFSSRLFSLLCLAVLLMVNYFATVGWMIEMPSIFY
jgi:hypothetical protein